MSQSRAVRAGDVVPLRTFDPKFTHYFSNGTGRDAFVMYNNGGYSVPRYFSPKQSTNFMRFKSIGSTNVSPRKDAMPVEYRSDGTGRDSYIVCNSGGL
jgi:hypothetical protein